MKLMLDPACELRTFADALYVGHACDEAGFFWYEDPMRDAAVSQHLHRKLRQMIKTPLLIGEHVRGLEPKADWIVNDATDFVRADPDLDLGVTGTMKIAHLAEAFGLDCEVHCAGPAHRACISAIRKHQLLRARGGQPEDPQRSSAGLHLRLLGPARRFRRPGVLPGSDRARPRRQLRLGFHQAADHGRPQFPPEIAVGRIPGSNPEEG